MTKKNLYKRLHKFFLKDPMQNTDEIFYLHEQCIIVFNEEFLYPKNITWDEYNAHSSLHVVDDVNNQNGILLDDFHKPIYMWKCYERLIKEIRNDKIKQLIK
jgi:hypothetical protein